MARSGSASGEEGMVAAHNRTPQWFFYPAWVAVSAISIPIAWAIAVAIMSRVVDVVGGTIQVGGQTHITEDMLMGYVLLPLLGLSSGFLQYLLLRPYVPRIGWWTVATLVGWVLPFVMIGALLAAVAPPIDMTAPWATVISVVVFGGAMGLAQWLILRGRVRHASWWILASVLGWGLAILLTGGPISSTQDVVVIALLPPVVASIAWWLLFHQGSGELQTAMA